MTAWTSSERFWIDVMNIGMGLLVALPLLLTVGAILSDWLSRPRAHH